MNKYPIFYVVHAQFYENSDEKNKKVKKITEVFENEKPKIQRSRSLVFSRKISSMILAKNDTELPEYYLNYFFKKKDLHETSIEDVLFFETRSKVNLSLTLSFGIKNESATISKKKINEPSLPSIFPILAIGKSLGLVENSLKLGLVLEKMYYEYYNQEEPKTHTFGRAGFLPKKFIEDTLVRYIHDFENNLSLKLIKKSLYGFYFNIFPTFQFYQVSSVKSENIHCKNTFFENLSFREENKYRKKTKTYTKQLKIISKLLGVDLLKLSEERLQKYLYDESLKQLPLFLVKEQFKVLDEIKSEIKYRNPSNYKINNLIKEWL